MLKQVVMTVIVLMCSSPLLMAEEPRNDLADMKFQAREEQRKEEELQMMRLELEKLKLELETRKVMASIGESGGGVSSSTLAARINLKVVSIVITSGGASAVIDIGGACQSVKENDKVEGFLIKTITADELILVDDKGVEIRSGVRT